MTRVHSNYKPGFSEYIAPDPYRWVDVYAPATIFLMAFVGLAATVWRMLP